MGYLFTVFGVIIRSCFSFLTDFGVSGSGEELAGGLTLVIAIVLTGIGVIKTLIAGEGLVGKAIGLAVHALIWVIVSFGMSIILPIILFCVALFVVDFFFLGRMITNFIWNRFAGPDGDGEVTWPAMIFDYEHTVWMLTENYGENATYTNNETGKKITVHISEVKEKEIDTVHGIFTW